MSRSTSPLLCWQALAKIMPPLPVDPLGGTITGTEALRLHFADDLPADKRELVLEAFDLLDLDGVGIVGGCR